MTLATCVTDKPKRPAPTQCDLHDALTAIFAGKKPLTPRIEAVVCSVPDLR